MKTIRETSDEVIRLMTKDLKSQEITDSINVLEPSCGNGKIIRNLIDREVLSYYNHYDMVELNEERLNEAKNSSLKFIKTNFYKSDFLIWAAPKTYDLIIACPPFKDNVDLAHIQKMYSLLNKGGELITLTSPLWVTNNEKHQVAFREFLEQTNYTFTLLPDNSFVERGKSVLTGILKFKK